MLRTGLRRALPVLLALGVAACSGRAPGDPPAGVGSTSVEWAGVRIAWELLAAPDDRLRVTATVANVAGRTVDRDLPLCLNHLRLYRGDALLWDRGGTGDCFGLQSLRLAPTESRSYHTGLTAAEVLGDSIPPGEFTVRVHVPGNDRPGLPRADMELTLGQKLLQRE